MNTFGVMSSCSRSRPRRTRSLDSGVDVLVEINFDDSQPSSDTEETRDDKQNPPSDRTSPERKGDAHSELSAPDATEELKVCPSSVVPEADAGPTLAVPPPLPPRFYKKTSASEKTISQGAALKALTEEDEFVNQRPSLTGRAKGFSQHSDGEIPEHGTLGTVPEPESKPSLPPKPPIKPPRLNIPDRQQTCEQDAVKGETERRSPPRPKPKPRKQNQALRDGLEEVKATDRRRQEDSLDTRTTGLDAEGTEGAAELETTSQRGATLSEAAQTQTLCHWTQLPVTESQDEADGQFSPGPGPLHGTEEPNLEPRQLGDAQEPGETEVERRLKQTPKARNPLKQLAKKIVCQFKDRKEEKRRNKAEEADPAAVTQEETEPWEGGGVKEEDWMDGSRERLTTQSRFKKRQEASKSVFGSFKVYSPGALLGDLLLDDTWSRFLNPEQSISPESSPPPTRLSDSLPNDSDPEGVLSPDLLRVGSVAAEEESIYEDVNIPGFNQEETNRAASSHPLEGRSDISLGTDRLYETVDLRQPRQCTDIFTTAESHGGLDTSVQKYLIKLNKMRKHKRKRHGAKHRHTNAFGPSTSLQIFSSSVFYHGPAAGGGEEQLPTVASAGN